MGARNVIYGDFQEDSSLLLRARVFNEGTVPGAEGTAFLRANFTAAALTVLDVTDPNDEFIVSGFDAVALTVNSVFFDTMQAWDRDSTGHNFRYVVGPTAFPTGGNRYRVRVKLTHTDGRIGHVAWEGVAHRV